MTILTDDDKQTVKRAVPKPANKIHAGAVAKLYIAYPDRSRWTYTGLQGAAVLANDLVGHTWWIKLVDISSAGRGVLWDQEIYQDFKYNQDRTFFHTFELEECLAGLSFADEKEAKQFKKKVDEREKNSHKNTKAKLFSGAGSHSDTQSLSAGGGKSHGLSSLFSRHKHSQNQAPAQSIIPPRGVEVVTHNGASSPAPAPSRMSDIDLNDPKVQEVLQELEALGITADQIEEHKAFILTFLEQNKATAAAEAEKSQRAARMPPPPPPSIDNLSPQNTGSSKGGRGPPPAPPPSRRSAGGAVVQRPPSPSPSPPREPSPPRPRFRAPPPIADAGKFAHEPTPPSLPGRNRASSQSQPGPAPPPRPAKVPLENDTPQTTTRFGVPPPFEGKRVTSGPPPPPARGGVPPPPPPRDSQAPPPPPRGAVAPISGPPLPPPLPPSSSRPVPPAPGGAAPPPAPPLPPPSTSGPPPPPPLPPMSGGGPPPPPPMPPRAGGDSAPPLPKVSAPGRDGLLADIRGGARLKKVSDSEKRDRSAAMVPGSEAAASAPSSGTGGGGAAAQGGLAGALASALAVRKSKVSHSDDEDDDDAW